MSSKMLQTAQNRSEMAQKILGLDELSVAVAKIQQSGQTVVHCHGVFDLVHPGHIRHLEAAARLRYLEACNRVCETLVRMTIMLVTVGHLDS